MKLEISQDNISNFVKKNRIPTLQQVNISLKRLIHVIPTAFIFSD